MFRKSSGRLGFSFGRLVQNAVPNLARKESPTDADLAPDQMDSLFLFQLGQEDPKPLSPEAFYIAGVVENPATSAKVLHALRRANILSADPKEPTVYTSRITRRFPHQLAFIPLYQQRRLVSLLFFWEEELMRWRILEGESAEIREVVEGIRGQSADDGLPGDEARLEELQIALSTVEVKRRMVPSRRSTDPVGAANDRPASPQEDVLPGYGERMGSVSVDARRTTSDELFGRTRRDEGSTAAEVVDEPGSIDAVVQRDGRAPPASPKA